MLSLMTLYLWIMNILWLVKNCKKVLELDDNLASMKDERMKTSLENSVFVALCAQMNHAFYN